MLKVKFQVIQSQFWKPVAAVKFKTLLNFQIVEDHLLYLSITNSKQLFEEYLRWNKFD
jgi:hypothetical protein